MSKFKKWIKSSRTQMALASGASIVIIAAFTKWVLMEPLDPLLLAVPPLIEAAYEYVLKKYKESKICTTWYWVAAILVATVLVLLFSWIIK